MTECDPVFTQRLAQHRTLPIGAVAMTSLETLPTSFEKGVLSIQPRLNLRRAMLFRLQRSAGVGDLT